MKTRLSLGHLHAILDENWAALAHYHRASRLLRGDESRILYRTCLVVEGQHLLRTGCVRRAERCARRGLNCLDPGGGDLFSYANLLALRAGCEIARRNETAAVTLREAWPCLEQLTELSRKVGLEDVGSGVHAAYATWWTTEAARRRLTGDVSGELEAAQQALDRTRRGAAGWNTLVWNAGVMRALRRLAEACERADQHAEAEQRRTIAEAIRIRWHLPLHRFKPSLVARLKLTIRRRGSLR